MFFVLTVPTYVPNLMLNYALKTVQPTVSSIYTYLQPVLAIAISVGMGLDKLHADTVIFALVIFVGVGLVLRSYAVKPRQADPPAAGPH
jgi:drug/metabolite transporter (DMT)-like permease